MEKGKEAIKEFCEEKQKGKRVIAGGLEYLVPNWERITQGLEVEYRLTFDEYLNDMDCRKIISEVWPLASEEQIALYSANLAEADTRFFEHTVSVELCIWGKHNEAKRGYKPDVDWWYYREPKRTSNKWRGNHFVHRK
jgi:hypothetical protein